MAANLHNLPVELLYSILLISSSSSLPLVSRTLWKVYKQAPPSITVLYLPENIQHALNYPIMNEVVLEHYIRLRPLDHYDSIAKFPVRLFRNLKRPSRKNFSLDLNEGMPPISFLKAMLSLLSNRVDVNFPNGYPLRCAVRSGNVPLVRLLLQAGANPFAGSDPFQTPLLLSVHLRSLEMLKLLIEEGAKWLQETREDGRKRFCLPIHLLSEAFTRKAFDIVRYLTEERGMIPTLETLQWLTDQSGVLETNRKRKRRLR